ncbi:MAG: BCCT family transporter, partial [Halobacteriota archaeon]
IGPMLVAVVTCLVLLVSPWGSIRLGGPDAEPTYTLPVYFTMFFTAGIAAGIVFWGPAEALFHYDAPPPYLEASARSEGVITGALMYSLFHWGFSAWSAYLIVGLPIAYAVFQRGAPLRVSAILSPFLGVENLDHPLGKLVDVLAIFATIGGIATSVALVSQQFLTGIDFQWGVATGDVGPVVFVAGLTAVFVISAQSGVHRGIRRIANVNIILFAFVGLLLLALGPRDVLLSNGAAAIGEYGVNILPLSLEFGDQWVADWTVWNWVWWFSWAPFAGLFVAALSRGRTIRTVVLTGFVATSLATMVWFLIFGSVALELQHTGQVDVLGAIAAGGSEAVAAFPVLSALPLSELLIFLLLAMIIVFMTTSADTSTLVVSVLSTRAGDAPTPGSIGFWGTFQGLVAVAVMLTGGEAALQTAAVLLGGPIAIIAVIAIAGLLLELVRDGRDEGVPVGSGSGD